MKNRRIMLILKQVALQEILDRITKCLLEGLFLAWNIQVLGCRLSLSSKIHWRQTKIRKACESNYCRKIKQTQNKSVLFLFLFQHVGPRNFWNNLRMQQQTWYFYLHFLSAFKACLFTIERLISIFDFFLLNSIYWNIIAFDKDYKIESI